MLGKGSSLVVVVVACVFVMLGSGVVVGVVATCWEALCQHYVPRSIFSR